MTPRRVATLALLPGLISFAACAQRGQPTVPPVSPSSAARAAPAADADWLNMFARGYFPGRSGQIFFVPHEGDFLVDKDPLYSFMHGSPWPYDTHLPLLFHGKAFVRAGTFTDAVAQQDVAPTLASLIGIAPPATTTGRTLTAALLDAASRPRVAALIVLDGMRVDYFDTYAEVMPTLGRLRKEGAWFANARATSMPTATSIGHATLGTGTDPRIHGLVVNRLFNRVTGKSQESYNALDPGELLALTLADVWNLATDGRAVIVGQGGAIRAAAGLVGHGACLVNARKTIAASYSTRDAGWETNAACYAMSPALEMINGARYWQEAGGSWLGHDIASPARFRASALFQRFEGDALAAVLEQEPIGADEVTDLVLVNIKSPDYVSHAYGPASPELRETLGELDRQLARAVQMLEKKAGPDRLVLAITADHGMPGEPAPPRRRIQVGEVVAALDQQFSKGGASVVDFFGDPANAQIHMDVARLKELGVSLDDVAAFLRAKFFAAVHTEDEVRRAQSELPFGQ
jgi:predicted AlkP superfamily pyrophosphatase or phosphodiesterase